MRRDSEASKSISSTVERSSVRDSPSTAVTEPMTTSKSSTTGVYMRLKGVEVVKTESWREGDLSFTVATARKSTSPEKWVMADTSIEIGDWPWGDSKEITYTETSWSAKSRSRSGTMTVAREEVSAR